MADKHTINYQELSNELESIIDKLQDDTTSIEESLKLYERGVTITKELKDYLVGAENSLKKISAESKED